MKQIIKDNLDLEYIRNSSIKGFATCCELPFLSTSYFSLNDNSSNRLQSILLASSALPIVYGAEEIDGNKYVDGGLRAVSRYDASTNNLSITRRRICDLGRNRMYIYSLGRV
jgi:predicted patatin/cPLA2 family phospholipase